MISKQERAKCSRGTSSDAVYRMVTEAIRADDQSKCASLLDFGCGAGRLLDYVHDLVESYEGVDIVQYEEFPKDIRFHLLDLDQGRAPLPDSFADLVVAVETIEHLENPRALMRELARVCKPGGRIIVTTPNQLSLLSKLTLLMKNNFNAFADSCYPAHITALLEIDLHRIARETGLERIRSIYSQSGRVVFTSMHYPSFFSRWMPRACSDNLGIVATKPIANRN